MADSASDKQRLKTAAESIWRNQQMSTQSVASALMDLIARYVDGEGRQAAEIATLQKRVEELEKQRDAADSARKHTQEWYSRHYGKLQDWARKRLPEEWADEFFNCVANGTWGHKDRGKPYTCNAGFVIEPTNYFRVDTAEGQLILDQTKRAEDAEAKNAALTRQLEEERARLDWWIANDTACLMESGGMFAVYKDGECISIWFENPRYSLDYAARNTAKELSLGRNDLCECGDARWKHFTASGQCEVCVFCEKFQKFDPRIARNAAKEPKPDLPE